MSKETNNLCIFSNLSPKKNMGSDSESLHSSPEKQKKLKVRKKSFYATVVIMYIQWKLLNYLYGFT